MTTAIEGTPTNAIECDHSCCPHPWLRTLDQYGGRIAPTRGQCDHECHEADAVCTVHGKRVPENRGGWERSTRWRAEQASKGA